jgi:hypothetical protein
MRSQKGKALSWIIFAVLIVGAFALLWFWQKKPVPAPVTAPVSAPSVTPEAKKPSKGFAKQELSKQEQGEIDNEAMNQALRGSGDCEAILYNDVLRQTCIDTLLFDKALKANDPKLCEQIQDKTKQSDCLNRVYLILATRGSDLLMCDKISDDKLKQDCKDQIHSQNGRTATSAKDCDVIQDETLKQTCLDNFVFASSVQALTVASCDTIQDAELKSRCSKTVTKNLEVIEVGKAQMLGQKQSTEQQLQGCAALSGSEADRCKDQSNFDLAAEKKDLAYCNLIKDSAFQKSCVDTQTTSINRYYLRMATTQKDSSLCSKILDEALRATCMTYAK